MVNNYRSCSLHHVRAWSCYFLIRLGAANSLGPIMPHNLHMQITYTTSTALTAPNYYDCSCRIRIFIVA